MLLQSFSFIISPFRFHVKNAYFLLPFHRFIQHTASEGRVWLIRSRREPANWLCTLLKREPRSEPRQKSLESPNPQYIRTCRTVCPDTTEHSILRYGQFLMKTRRSGISVAAWQQGKSTVKLSKSGAQPVWLGSVYYRSSASWIGRSRGFWGIPV